MENKHEGGFLLDNKIQINFMLSIGQLTEKSVIKILSSDEKTAVNKIGDITTVYFIGKFGNGVKRIKVGKNNEILLKKLRENGTEELNIENLDYKIFGSNMTNIDYKCINHSLHALNMELTKNR